ncbi:MAG TPA: GNAT family N-acetyltransferase [Candidatus Acidoferrales bacterium]|jgi:GNAT superfamily N-acetyltransferase|nr:GNAT family N-acetyltransferase [Candidatus Acidoferrales bacterium]
MVPRMNAPSSVFTGEIRPAQEADCAGIAELSGQLSYPSTREEVTQRMTEMRGDIDHAVFVAQLATGEIAGWIAVFVYRTVEADARAEVSGLVVDERFRSQRIGERLLARSEEWARERGCDVIGLRSNVIRERAHAFYERHGYTHIKTQKSFRKPL